MKTELNRELKQRFFAQYINQEVIQTPRQVYTGGYPTEPSHEVWGSDILTMENIQSILHCGFPLFLRPISSITDAEAIEVANMAFLTGKKQWAITKRDKTGVWMDGVDHLNIGYYFRLNDYAEIYASSKYSPQEKYEHNIGRCGNSCLDGVPYVNIVDYLRSKGFAIPYMGHSVAELVKAGWIKLVAG